MWAIKSENIAMHASRPKKLWVRPGPRLKRLVPYVGQSPASVVRRARTIPRSPGRTGGVAAASTLGGTAPAIRHYPEWCRRLPSGFPQGRACRRHLLAGVLVQRWSCGQLLAGVSIQFGHVGRNVRNDGHQRVLVACEKGLRIAGLVGLAFPAA